MSESLSQQPQILGTAVTRIISDYTRQLEDAPLNSGATPAELAQLFAGPMPESGASVEEILDRFTTDIAPHAMQISSPRYYGQFNPAPLPIGVWADALASALNQNAGAWRNGPSSALVETQVLRWLCELIGYGPESFGVLASGGTEANLIALKCARDRAHQATAKDGLRSAPGDLTVYASEQCHFSIERSVDILGLGRHSLRKIAVDENFHVRPDALQQQLESDRRAGCVPCCVIGIAGATSTGVIDPLPQLAAI